MKGWSKNPTLYKRTMDNDTKRTFSEETIPLTIPRTVSTAKIYVGRGG